MKFLGILRASGLCLLAIGFHSPRGVFCSNLEVNPSNESSSVDVSENSGNLMDSTVESSSASSAPAPKSALVFESSEWDDSMLASTVLFLEEFCEASTVKRFSGVFSEKDFEKLSYICGNISFTLLSITDHFTPKYCPGIVGGKEIDMNMYEDILKPEKMDVYADWLVKNIPQIRQALQDMHRQGMPLTSEQAKTDTKVGPLRYGFVSKNFGWRSMSVCWLSGSTI
ncbi:secreted antigen 1, partial [Babesia divergens]